VKDHISHAKAFEFYFVDEKISERNFNQGGFIWDALFFSKIISNGNVIIGWDRVK